MVENVVEELSARCVLENDADVFLSLDHLVETDNVWVRDLAQNSDLAVNLRKACWVTSNAVPTDKLDGDLATVTLGVKTVIIVLEHT